MDQELAEAETRRVVPERGIEAGRDFLQQLFPHLGDEHYIERKNQKKRIIRRHAPVLSIYKYESFTISARQKSMQPMTPTDK